MLLRVITDMSFGRDFLYVLIFNSIILLFYISGKMFRRVKDSGFVSSTTGFGIYFFGEGLFHIGSLILLFYDTFDSDANIVGFRLLNSAYLVAMGLFSIFTDLEQDRLNKMHGIEKKNPFLNSIVSMLIIGILLPLAVNSGEIVSLAFILIIFPFISSSSKSLNRLEGLKMLEETQPGKWFFIGLSLSGFSNFLTGLPLVPELSVAIMGLCVISGALLMMYGWNLIPNSSELEWFRKLEQIMVLQRQGSLILYSYEFKGGKSNTTSDENLLASGALSGIQSLLSQIMSSNDLINEIDHGDKTLYFEHIGDITFALFCNDKGKEFSPRLQFFAKDFMTKYYDVIQNWKGNLDDFQDAVELIRADFVSA